VKSILRGILWLSNKYSVFPHPQEGGRYLSLAHFSDCVSVLNFPWFQGIRVKVHIYFWKINIVNLQKTKYGREHKFFYSHKPLLKCKGKVSFLFASLLETVALNNNY
jgi:hypothetical protein